MEACRNCVSILQIESENGTGESGTPLQKHQGLLIKDVSEEAESAEDEPVEIQEILYLVPPALEDDELEHKRSHLDDGPLHQSEVERIHFCTSETHRAWRWRWEQTAVVNIYGYHRRYAHVWSVF